MRRTKIVCTIGPSCSSHSKLHALIRAGMDVARLNFSHGTHEQHAEIIKALRKFSIDLPRPLAILQDLSGPKVRIGGISSGSIYLKRGHCILFTSESVPGDHECISLPVPELLRALSPGDRLLADDGNVELRVIERSGGEIVAKVLNGGTLSSNKGITSPGVNLDLAAVTNKDIDDLRFGLEHGVDWVAASYIRGPEDIEPIRKEMAKAGIHRPIIAKIEKLEAVKRIDEIIEAVDGVMVARGDLGVEIPIDEVPIVQKRLIKLCNRAGKPVITATQMLESMMHNPRPTRAEVTDVANAILDGADAVMLSGETAAGDYPLQAARMMAKVAVRADACLRGGEPFAHHKGAPDVTDAVAQATVEIARSVKAAAILCATTSGSTARLTAKYRPETPIIAVTPIPETYRRLALTWGVRSVLIDPVTDTDAMMEATVNSVAAGGIVKNGDRVIITAGVPVNIAGSTNLIKVHEIGQPIKPSSRR